MPLLELKCKSCGAVIEFDDSKPTVICKYCNTEYLKEDLIVNNHYHNEFNNATFILNDENSIENKLKNADYYLNEQKEYEKAKEIYQYVVDNKGSDYRGWWGLAKALTSNFTMEKCSEEYYARVKKCAETAIRQADEDKRVQLESEWREYSRKLRASIDKANATAARKKKIRTTRKAVAITLSSICNIAVIAGIFIFDIHTAAHDKIEAIFAVLIALGINAVITTVLGLIGSTGFCSTFPAITALIAVAVVIHGMMINNDVSLFANTVSLIVLCVIAVAVVGICFAVPTFILKKKK